MKKILRSLLLVALLSGLGRAGLAKDKASTADEAAAGPQPIVVVSISGYDRVMDDIGFFGQLAKQPGLKKQADATITFFTQGKGLEGLDKKRPWGLVYSTDSGNFQLLGFLPVKDLDTLLDSVAGLIGPVEKKDDGILLVEQLNQTLYLKEKGGWLFIAQSADALGTLPADPAKALGGLDKDYELAVRLYVHNIPEFARSMAVDYLRSATENAPPPSDDEDEDAAEKRKEFQAQQIKSMAEAINSIDQLTLGLNIDQSTTTGNLDVMLSALPDTKLAEKLAGMKETTSNYNGFILPKAAAFFNSSQTLLVDDIDQSADAIDQAQAKLNEQIENSPDITDDDSREAVKKIVEETCDAIKATIKTGKVDLGGSLVLGDRRLTLLAGAYVAEPGELEKAFTDGIAVAKKDPNFPGTKFNTVTDGDVHYHTWTSIIPADDRVNRVLGKELKLAVGFGAKSVYLGVGTDDPLPALKKAIADSKTMATKKIPPGVVDVSIKPFLDFAATLKPDDENIAAVQAEVAKAPGKDHVHLHIKSLANGVSYRLELQEGVLKALGLSVKRQMDKQNRRGQ